MTQFVVLFQDCRQGEFHVIGPFTKRTDAFIWASRDADEKAEQVDMRPGLDAWDEDGLVINDANDDPVYEWSVQTMADPGPPRKGDATQIERLAYGRPV